ncbi:MAG: FAD-dependent oxidoreductase [Immundisolibacter sp.]|uniref:FAD-dependent oxidoreductase n=1 Tax=Immundisolibacter sp. TaxID=1934948 RepID=UPI003EE38810
MTDRDARPTAAWDEEFDWIVVGSGGGGMTSALTAHHHGLRSLIIEKSAYVGGSTARSGGCVWIPNNYLALEGGLPDSEELARTYMAATVGDRTPAALQQAYLKYGPEMIRFLRDHSAMQFEWSKGYSDYYPEAPGGFADGRALEPLPFDGHQLGSNFRYLRPPVMPGVRYTSISLRAAQIMGGMRRHWSGRRQLLKTMYDTTRNILTRKAMLTMGQGVAGRLYYSVLRAGVPVERNTALTRLIQEDGRVLGVEVTRNFKPRRYRTTRGVLLAAGGFAHNQAMRDQYHPQPSQAAWSIAVESDTGDGIRAGQVAGARLDLMEDAWWGPVSQISGQRYPNFSVTERSTPGAMVVNSQGERFVNEAAPYSDVVHRIHELHNSGGVSHVPCWIILDRANRNSYMLGLAMPALPLPRKFFEHEDFFKAPTLQALAQQIGVPGDRLLASVRKFNAYAESGVDPEFHRGESAYDRIFGDPHFRNPNLAPLIKPPFYAVKLYPGDIGTRGGLVTNALAQVLDQDGGVIQGLWAAGNTMASVMGHSYPGPGATIGPSMTFGYVAALAAAGKIPAEGPT